MWKNNSKKRCVMILLAGVLAIVACVGCGTQNEPLVIGGSANKATEIAAEPITTERITTEQMTSEPVTEQTTTAAVQNYPEYPMYVRTMGVGSVGCEYGYCKLGEKSGEEILADLSGFSSFFNSPEHSEGVALYYDEEPREVKLYHALAGSTEYEEYAFEGPDYDFPWDVEPMKYVICVPEEYGMHYFFAVITWADGEKDLMYFPMEYAVRESNNMGVYKDFYNWLVMNYCWPYDLYRYNAETDKYEMIASACSEDKAWIQDKFDDSLDIDGDGVLYLVQDGSAGDAAKVLNKADYEAWLESIMEDAKEINIPWKQLEFVTKYN